MYCRQVGRISNRMTSLPWRGLYIVEGAPYVSVFGIRRTGLHLPPVLPQGKSGCFLGLPHLRIPIRFFFTSTTSFPLRLLRAFQTPLNISGFFLSFIRGMEDVRCCEQMGLGWRLRGDVACTEEISSFVRYSFRSRVASSILECGHRNISHRR